MKTPLENASNNLALVTAAIGALTVSVADNVHAATDVPASPAPKVQTYISPAIEFINKETDPQVIAAYCKANVGKIKPEEFNAGILKFQQLMMVKMETMFAGKSQDEIKSLLAQKGNEWMKDEPYATKGRSIYAGAPAKAPVVTPPAPKPEANTNGIGGEGADDQNDNQDVQDPKPEAKPEAKPSNVAKKGPSILETKEEKKMRLEEEDLAKVRKEILVGLNKAMAKTETWKSMKPGEDGNDSTVKVENHKGGIKFSIPEGKQKGRAGFTIEMPAGNYIITPNIDGKMGIWWKGGKEIAVTNKPVQFELTENTPVDYYIKPTKIDREMIIADLKIGEFNGAEIASKQ